MSTEQRPIPTHLHVPEIAQELLNAPSLGEYDQLEPGQSFRLYYNWGARYIERGPGQLPTDQGPQTEWLDFQRLSPGQYCEWVVNASDKKFGAMLGGSTTFDMASTMNGVVKAGQFFVFSSVKPCKAELVAPDGDTLTVVGAEVEAVLKVGPVLGVEWSLDKP